MRNTICATLTTITLTLCIALAGCGERVKAPRRRMRSDPSTRMLCLAWRRS